MVVLKPVATQMVATLKEPALLNSGSQVHAEIEKTDVSLELGGAKLAASHTAGSLEAGAQLGQPEWAGSAGETRREDSVRLKPKSRDAIFDHVSEHIRREPEASTRLLQSWIGSGEGTPAREV